MTHDDRYDAGYEKAISQRDDQIDALQHLLDKIKVALGAGCTNADIVERVQSMQVERARMRHECATRSDQIDAAEDALPDRYRVDAEHNLHECIQMMAADLKRAGVAESLALAEVAAFNAGYEACRSGKDYEDQPSSHDEHGANVDDWCIGYVWAEDRKAKANLASTAAELVKTRAELDALTAKWAEADQLFHYHVGGGCHAERDKLRAELAMVCGALETAEQSLRAFNGLGLSADEEERMWALYQDSPEMKKIRTALHRAQGGERG